MININDLINKTKLSGCDTPMITAKVAQDLILKLLSSCKFNKNVTIKGGVVIRSISKNMRRATFDIDFDFIRYPLTDVGIVNFIHELNLNKVGLKIVIIGKPENLKHETYKGKRVFIKIIDNLNHYVETKIDIGVHKYISLEQIEFCFDVITDDSGVVLLINTKEQMFAEKLKSLLYLGPRSKRFKDLYDMYYLMNHSDKKKFKKYLNILIFSKSDNIKSISDIAKNLKIIFNSKAFVKGLNSSNRNWLLIDEKIIIKELLEYFDNF